MEMCGQLYAVATSPPGQEPSVLTKILCGPYSHSGCYRKEKNLLPILDIEPYVIQTITFQNSECSIPAVVQLVHYYFTAQGKSTLEQCTTHCRLEIAFNVLSSVSVIVRR